MMDTVREVPGGLDRLLKLIGNELLKETPHRVAQADVKNGCILTSRRYEG